METVIAAVQNGTPDPIKDSQENDGTFTPNPWYDTAPVIFDELQFTKAGVYTYYIREVTGNDPTIDYDTSIKKVTITVTDNYDGTLSSSVKYDNDDVLFENTLKVSGSIKNKVTVDYINHCTIKAELPGAGHYGGVNRLYQIGFVFMLLGFVRAYLYIRENRKDNGR